jgi:hypothetical protein
MSNSEETFDADVPVNRTAIAFIRLASIRLMLRRLTRYCYLS